MIHQESGNELDTLKSLLLENELRQLEEVVEKLHTIESRIEELNHLPERFSTLFEGTFIEHLSQKDGVLQDVLSRYLSSIIEKSATHNKSALQNALQTVLTPAIAQGITDNKEQMIDALYPIMGGMITKYVTQAIKEMMEKINKKIEQGFSVEHYKRKFKAKLTGVSETELLLEESSDATIRSIFIIHKKTGLLIAESHLKNSEIDDPHMVASMASAIKDFINNWIQKERERKEVQLLSYGNATLYIESAGSVYLIAFLDSEPDHEQRTHINDFFAKLVKQKSNFFQSFNGDLNKPEIKKITEQINNFLFLQSPREETKESIKINPAKWILISLGLLLFAWVGYRAKEHYNLYRLEKGVLEKTEEHVTLRIDNEKLYVEGNLHSYSHYATIIAYIKTHTDRQIVNHLGLVPAVFNINMEKNVQNISVLQQMQMEIDLLKKTLKDLKQNPSIPKE